MNFKRLLTSIFLASSCFLAGATGLGPYNPAQHAVNGFMPTQLPGLIEWIDACRNSYFTNSQSVHLLNDWSQSAFNLTNGTSSQRPTYSTSAMNGRAAVQFDGVDDALYCRVSATITQQAVFVVVIQNNTAAAQKNARIFSQRTTGFTHDYETNLIPIIQNQSPSSIGTFTASGSTWRSTLTISTNTALVITHTLDKNGTVVNFANGKSGAQYTSSVTNINCQDFMIGNLETVGSDGNHNGFISEIIVCSSLDSEKRLQVERYLGTKYGIVVQ